MSFWPTLPEGSALFIFMLCLVIGAFVLFKFCLDQFDKPSAANNENDPWKFVVLRDLTSRRQYVIGFGTYYGILMLIFLVASIVGPSVVFPIAKAVNSATGSAPPPALTTDASTFPILVAFFIVGLGPNLPKALDFELIVRRLAHKIAYIPKNMIDIFNFMRFSEFDASGQAITEAWNAVGFRRIHHNTSSGSDASDASSDRNRALLDRLVPLLDKSMLLYARAAAVSGDLDLAAPRTLHQGLSLEVFRHYRSQLENVFVNLQAAHGIISEKSAAEPDQRRRSLQNIERDLIKNLEFLYVLFACAITTKGTERVNDQLHALGFISDYTKWPGIPWDPIIKAGFAAAVVLLLAILVAGNTFQGTAHRANIPTDSVDVLTLLGKIILVHIFALAQAIRVRNRLIISESYFTPESGTGRSLAYAQIFFASAITSFVAYVILNLSNLANWLFNAVDAIYLSQISLNYVYLNLIWSTIPACCGVLTAVTMDRLSNTHLQRVTSGSIEGCLMGIVSLLAVAIMNKIPSLAGDPNQDYTGYQVFNFILYGGLGFILGFILPRGIRRYWAALENRLPDKISVLRTAVLQYFHDIRQFGEWLNTRNDRLDGKRPLDVLAEEAGVQRLVSFVAQTRTTVPRPAT